MVVCQPGITDVAKSKDTIVCTESTSGVDKPARISESDSQRCQCLALPVQPKEKISYILRRKPAARSRTVAKSGTKPVYQNSSDTEKYVEIANTSHSSGLLKFTHRGPRVFGKGKMKNANQRRPMWMSGNWPAHMTAKIVMASAARFTPVRQRWRNKSRMAEISVPAWPIPIHQTKLVISQPQLTVRLRFQEPIPFQMVQDTQKK